MPAKRLSTIVLAALGAVVVYLCWIIVQPFAKPIVFAAVLAIVLHPLHARVCRLVRNRNAAALLSTTAVVLALIVPAVLVGRAISVELSDAYQSLSQKSADAGGLSPYFSHLTQAPLAWIGRLIHVSQGDLEAAIRGRLEQGIGFLLTFAAGVVGNLTALAVNLVIAFFVLFFLFRDGRRALRWTAAALPVRRDYTARLFRRVNETLMATVYGVLAVNIVQGSLTGLAFWFLGLPSPVLWGLVTMLTALVPAVGTTAVWVPASVLLAVSGHWGKGLILAAWGTAIVHPVDNIVRPYVIGGRLKLHTLYVFFGLLGGLEAFGVMGLFIGPVVFSLMLALIGILREEGRANGWWRKGWRAEVQPLPVNHPPATLSRH
jgi:predicted PurR-regulated permease PerM